MSINKQEELEDESECAFNMPEVTLRYILPLVVLIVIVVLLGLALGATFILKKYNIV